jgi:hypothetical protein
MMAYASPCKLAIIYDVLHKTIVNKLLFIMVCQVTLINNRSRRKCHVFLNDKCSVPPPRGHRATPYMSAEACQILGFGGSDSDWQAAVLERRQW